MHSSPSSPLEMDSDGLVLKTGAWGVVLSDGVAVVLLVLSVKEKVV